MHRTDVRYDCGRLATSLAGVWPERLERIRAKYHGIPITDNPPEDVARRMAADLRAAIESAEYGCPHCGSAYVAELTPAIQSNRVARWAPNGEPASYDEAEFRDALDTYDGETLPRYECESCDRDFNTPSHYARTWRGHK